MWLALLALAVLFVGRPYIERLMFGAIAPRPAEARGNLSDVEPTNIGIFERAAPSVIQVVGRAANGGIGAGTGFMWDGAGHALTTARAGPAILVTHDNIASTNPAGRGREIIVPDRAFALAPMLILPQVP